MQTLTLQVQDHVYEKLFGLLNHFPKNEVKILEQSKYMSDDDYLRSIDGMVKSIHEARREPPENGVTLEKLDW